MNRIILLAGICMSIGLFSCTKTVKRKACFTFSKKIAKVGDTVYVFNCSEGYNKLIWITPSLTLDSLNKHQKVYAAAPGYYVLALRVGDYDMTSTTLATGEIMIDSFKVQ